MPSADTELPHTPALRPDLERVRHDGDRLENTGKYPPSDSNLNRRGGAREFITAMPSGKVVRRRMRCSAARHFDDFIVFLVATEGAVDISNCRYR